MDEIPRDDDDDDDFPPASLLGLPLLLVTSGLFLGVFLFIARFLLPYLRRLL